MHPYLPHLLSDIKAAHRTILPENSIREISFEEEMEEIEKWTEAEPAHTFGYYCGLEPVNFPPSKQLCKKDMACVCKAFRQMMFSWNLTISFPKKFPIPLQYLFLVKTLDEKTAIVNSGFMNIDYCSGYAPDCVFKEFCSCLEYWNSLPDDDINNISYDASENFPF
jgi:hypothetical protein